MPEAATQAGAEPVRVLVIEDDANIATILCERLVESGYAVEHATDGARAENALRQRPADLVLIDVGLPDTTGFELAPRLRELQPGVPLLFLTARSDPEDRIRGLELGAEDYVGKPFYFRELLLRMRRVHERAVAVTRGSGRHAGRVRIGVAQVDFVRFELVRDGAVHRLTHKECAVLQLLVEADGGVVSRDRILDRAWSEDEYPTPRTVDNFIVRLRRLVEADPQNPAAILSVRGVGYRLAGERTSLAPESRT